MGRLTKVKASGVMPYQQYLVPENLVGLYEPFERGAHDRIFPVVIADFPFGRFCIDGHHRLVMADLFDAELNAYVAESETDLMQASDFKSYDEQSLWRVNMTVAFTYESAKKTARRLAETGRVISFNALRQEYRIDKEHIRQVALLLPRH